MDHKQINSGFVLHHTTEEYTRVQADSSFVLHHSEQTVIRQQANSSFVLFQNTDEQSVDRLQADSSFTLNNNPKEHYGEGFEVGRLQADSGFPQTRNGEEFNSNRVQVKNEDIQSREQSLASEKKSYMIKSTELKYSDAENPKCWKYINQRRVGKVAHLLDAPKFKIEGTMETKVLSPKTTYGVYFVYKLNLDAKGFVQTPVEALISFVEIKNTERFRSVYLDPDNQVPSQKREDGWLEIEMGEFFNDQGEDGAVHMILSEMKHGNSKSGLIIMGIELRPKHNTS
ncbi:hypothetical protein GIB67_039938 [Kingdonia uniflora]|uniref:Uncharacterized protein n=1 Tax=Kingdonia uniflora TaxID=39325 RepID=A0A7J7P3F6_9MAGN|nr:hypothetical protein GIB67_039938 [Kingdonia uniflora]